MNNQAATKLRIVVLGLSITSSWGNGHATTYRALLSKLAARGHDILFLERDVPWYAHQRDLPHPEFCRTELYQSAADLRQRFSGAVRRADAVVVGSYVPDGVEVGEWVTSNAKGISAFYDIDTPVTLAKLSRGDHEYVTPRLISEYHLYLSFAGGPTLAILEDRFGSPRAEALYCSVDDTLYSPMPAVQPSWDLGYMGTYSDDRQPMLQKMLIDAAELWPQGRFVVAGPQYPASIRWPSNVERIEHLPPDQHRRFYCSQRFTLNITRQDMVRAGYSPSVRLFEAAACGVPIISDSWPGLETFFAPHREILESGSGPQTAALLTRMPEEERQNIARCARKVVLARDTSLHRAKQLETYLLQAIDARALGQSAAGVNCRV